MAFRAPPIQYYTPPPNRQFPKLVFLLVAVVVIVVALILWILLRRAWRVPCKTSLDCAGNKYCQTSTGLCRECLTSKNCPAGSACSTAFTCLPIQ